MKVYTGIGDQGTTNILGEKGVSKNDARVNAYGTIDELNSYVGLIGTYQLAHSYEEQLRWIQNHLFTIGSELASTPEALKKLKLKQVGAMDIQTLEQWIDEQTADLSPLQSFVLPGSCRENAVCHVARTVCRRAERLTVHLHTLIPVHPETLIFLNRLSDYFFTLARTMSRLAQQEDIIWKPNKD